MHNRRYKGSGEWGDFRYTFLDWVKMLAPAAVVLACICAAGYLAYHFFFK